MQDAFRYERRVEFRDTDAAGIVHFSVFFNYMEEAEHAFLRDLGMSIVMADELGRYSFPRVAVSCDYTAPVRFGDVVTIDVVVAKLGDSSVTYDFVFSLDREEVARGQVTAVCCRLKEDGVPVSMAIPTAIANRLAELVR